MAQAIALIVGCDGRISGLNRLNGVERDCADMFSMWQNVPQGRALSKKNEEPLLNAQASREAVLGRIKEAQLTLKEEGSLFFFYYSGHGSEQRETANDEDRDENDGIDEMLCTSDSNRKWIRDDELFALWTGFQKGVRIVMIADCCSAGTNARNAVPIDVAAKATRTVQNLTRSPSQNAVAAVKATEGIPHDLLPALPPKNGAPRAFRMGLGTNTGKGLGITRSINSRDAAIHPRVSLDSDVSRVDGLHASLLHIGACRDSRFSNEVQGSQGIFTAVLASVIGGAATNRQLYDLVNDKVVAQTKNFSDPRARQQPEMHLYGPFKEFLRMQKPFDLSSDWPPLKSWTK